MIPLILATTGLVMVGGILWVSLHPPRRFTRWLNDDPDISAIDQEHIARGERP